MDGKPWPVQSATALNLPAGSHVVEPAPSKRKAISLIDLNAKLLSASIDSGKRVVFEYSSESRAIAVFDRKPLRMEVDGAPWSATTAAVLLPRGNHRVTAD